MSSVVNHVGCCVTDVDRSRRFYEELLDFKYERELSPPDEMSAQLLSIRPPLGLKAVYLRRGNFVLELLHYDRPDNPPATERAMNEPGLTHLSLSVDDLPGVLARVPGLGGRVRADTNLGVAVFIEDPDGQLIELLAPGPS